MTMQWNLEKLEQGLRERIEPFLLDVEEKSDTPIVAAYLTGPASRGEWNSSLPELELLLVFDRIDEDLLEALASLGIRYGKTGIKAPLLLTSEYVTRAHDVFPMEFCELKSSHLLLGGSDMLATVEIDSSHLRLQVERELRSWRLRLRQGYLRAAGDGTWMAAWFADAVPDLFPVLRGLLKLLHGDPDAGNTEMLQRLAKACEMDLGAVVEVWEARKSGTKLGKDRIRGLYQDWDQSLDVLIGKVDTLEVERV